MPFTSCFAPIPFDTFIIVDDPEFFVPYRLTKYGSHEAFLYAGSIVRVDNFTNLLGFGIKAFRCYGGVELPNPFADESEARSSSLNFELKQYSGSEVSQIFQLRGIIFDAIDLFYDDPSLIEILHGFLCEKLQGHSLLVGYL